MERAGTATEMDGDSTAAYGLAQPCEMPEDSSNTTSRCSLDGHSSDSGRVDEKLNDHGIHTACVEHQKALESKLARSLEMIRILNARLSEYEAPSSSSLLEPSRAFCTTQACPEGEDPLRTASAYEKRTLLSESHYQDSEAKRAARDQTSADAYVPSPDSIADGTVGHRQPHRSCMGSEALISAKLATFSKRSEFFKRPASARSWGRHAGPKIAKCHLGRLGCSTVVPLYAILDTGATACMVTLEHFRKFGPKRMLPPAQSSCTGLGRHAVPLLGMFRARVYLPRYLKKARWTVYVVGDEVLPKGCGMLLSKEFCRRGRLYIEGPTLA